MTFDEEFMSKYSGCSNKSNGWKNAYNPNKTIVNIRAMKGMKKYNLANKGFYKKKPLSTEYSIRLLDDTTLPLTTLLLSYLGQALSSLVFI